MSKFVDTSIEKVWHGNEVKIQGQKVVNKSTYEIGLVVEGQAKLLCAVNYGYLAASITTQSVDEGTELATPVPQGKDLKYPHDVASFVKIKKPPANEVYVGTAVDYGPHVEFGTVRMDAQPFLRPAFWMAMGKVLTIVRKHGKWFFKEFLK